jgi:hypothetical protein
MEANGGTQAGKWTETQTQMRERERDERERRKRARTHTHLRSLTHLTRIGDRAIPHTVVRPLALVPVLTAFLIAIARTVTYHHR